MRASLLLLLLLALITGCDSAEPDPDPQIAGSYEGSFESGDPGETYDVGVTLTVTEAAGGTLSGNVIMNIAGIPLGLTVAGTHTYPDFTMRFESSGFDDIIYSGTTSVSGTRLEGEMNGSGFSDVDLTLAR